MTAAEEGVLLLCCQLGDKDSKPLTVPQFRELGLRVRASSQAGDRLQELSCKNLRDLGYDTEQADRILRLLDREAMLGSYDRYPALTSLSAGYPSRFTKFLGHDRPTAFFYDGDLSLLERPSVAVVGSRKLNPPNEAFARLAGRLAAEEGLVLVSGGAAGADTAAQEACLEAGGSCVIFAADELHRHKSHNRVLRLSAYGYDLPFSPYRALDRNRCIHMQGDRVLAAQCTYGSGGTWQGCLENLRHQWSPIFVYDDGSPGARSLAERGAAAVHTLHRIQSLTTDQMTLF